jgi:hypothetical protein
MSSRAYRLRVALSALGERGNRVARCPNNLPYQVDWIPALSEEGLGSCFISTQSFRCPFIMFIDLLLWLMYCWFVALSLRLPYIVYSSRNQGVDLQPVACINRMLQPSTRTLTS